MVVTPLVCLAMAVYWEARSEPLVGQLGVAQTVINRVVDPRHPNSICEVVVEGPKYKSGIPVRHKCQFSFYCDGKSEEIKNPSAWNIAIIVSVKAMKMHLDITYGATHYHTNSVNPYWKNSMKVTTQLGNHIFYKNN